jgi:hypothetical protein
MNYSIILMSYVVSQIFVQYAQGIVLAECHSGNDSTWRDGQGVTVWGRESIPRRCSFQSSVLRCRPRTLAASV